jgi:hypothetical protein
MTFHFLPRLRKTTAPDLWRFAKDVREVMWWRISRGASGRLSAEEARRMVLEKHSAGVRAQLVYMEWLFKGNPAAANHAAFDIYHRAVKSNRRRLNRLRWRWPTG